MWHSSPHSVCTIRRNTWRDCGYQEKDICTFTLTFPETILNKSFRCGILVSFPVPVTRYPGKRKLREKDFYSGPLFKTAVHHDEKVNRLGAWNSWFPYSHRKAETWLQICVYLVFSILYKYPDQCMLPPQWRWIFPHQYNSSQAFPQANNPLYRGDWKGLPMSQTWQLKLTITLSNGKCPAKNTGSFEGGWKALRPRNRKILSVWFLSIHSN